ncbi:MAG TPA: type II toxin-antitoxin system Phd/YefM family antitoxin [Planctomycetota bacterium]|nr:type II toxin-antitoxin system Phd/YefM family antitoxin [Planctomycetota bacterium]
MTQQVHPIRPEDIHSLTDFLRNHRQALERLRKSGRPEVLTVHGKASVVVQAADAYQRVLELAERMDAIIGVTDGLDSIDHGEGVSLDEFKSRFRAKYPLPDTPGATGTEGR